MADINSPEATMLLHADWLEEAKKVEKTNPALAALYREEAEHPGTLVAKGILKP